MEYQKLGSCDLEVSRMGFGCWELGGAGYGEVVEEEASRAVNLALDLGVTLFDTAPMYGSGHSEEVLGKALGSRRKEAIIVTKVGLEIGPERRGRDSSPERIVGGLEESLERLGTDYVDLCLVHWPDLEYPRDETARAMLSLIETGKTRYIGVSNHSAAQMEEFMAVAPIHCHQMGYNIFNRRVTRERMPFCLEHGIGVMAYGSLCYGLLTGAFTAETRFEKGDWRAGKAPAGLLLWSEENLEHNAAIAGELKDLAESLGMTLPQMALNWVLHRPPVNAALVGIRNRMELEENVKSIGMRLSEDTMEAIERISKPVRGGDTELPK